MDQNKKICIIGGGLVGSLNACYMAKRGFEVHLFEKRDDIRLSEYIQGRSINLALSYRGREALAAVGLEETVVKAGIPMRARMIHNLAGSTRPIPYGTKPDEYIMAVDRRKLNELLLSSAEKNPNIHLYFNHRFASCDFDTGVVQFKKDDKSIHSDTFDLTLGNDGAYSGLRQAMTKMTRINYSQEYIPHGYLELHFPPTEEGKHSMAINYLHIWPRGQFMLIGLPNLDGSFTGTLFMPFHLFEGITNNEELVEFFKNNFPDAIDLIGLNNLQQMYFATKPQSLISIECSPYHVGSKFLLMGDAAHAMVPFYGQGMNCGFEDCLIFDQLMDQFNNNLELAVPKFTEVRNADAKAICKLAMYNYIEMRDSVNSSLFLLRKKLDNCLHRIFPNLWVPLYTMVSFTRTPYTKAIADRNWQNKVITHALGSTMFATTIGFGYLLYRLRNNFSFIPRPSRFV